MNFRDTVISDNKRLKEFDSFTAYPALRWMSGASDDTSHMLCLLNTNDINKDYFELWKHKDIQAKALASIGTGKPVKHVYVKAPSNMNTSRLYDLIFSYYHDFDYEDCDHFLSLCDLGDIKELALMSNLYNDEKSIKPVIDEFKKLTGKK